MLIPQLNQLEGQSLTELKKHWHNVMGSDPPKGISSRLMVRAIAYEIQAKQQGGLKIATIRKLSKIVKSSGRDEVGISAKTAPDSHLRPGTRLVREWNGITHTVDVVDKGFEWRDQRYSSLSRIAREITGAHWSGPRFFGLNGTAAS